MSDTRTTSAGVYLRLGAALAALLAGIVAALVIARLLDTTPGPIAPRASGVIATPSRVLPTTTPLSAPRSPGRIATPTAPGFPSPPQGAVVFSRQDGSNALGLALVSKPARLTLQASVVGPDGSGVTGLSVSFRVTTSAGRAAAAASPCGDGCYLASVAVKRAPQRVQVLIGDRPRRRQFDFALPRAWPPPAANRLVARAAAVWRGLRTLVSHERLASSPTNAITTLYRMAAPSSFSYDIAGGASAVVIGTRRWDRPSPTEPWLRSTQQPPLRQPVPYWLDVRNARVVASPLRQGRATWRVTFFDPRIPGWFQLEIEKRTLRTLDLRMTATAHFMHDVFGPFNEPFELRPPQ